MLFSLFPADRTLADISYIFYHGMDSRPRENGLLQLERTGPFIPPITFPGAGPIIVTNATRQALIDSNLSGFTFLPVIKAHIVEFHWQGLRWNAPKLPEVSKSGEPEDYILDRPHSPVVAEKLGELWEVEFVTIPNDRYQECNLDWFRCWAIRGTALSKNAKIWMRANLSRWVKITPLELASV